MGAVMATEYTGEVLPFQEYTGEVVAESAIPVNPMGARPKLMPQEEMTSTDKWLASRKGLSSDMEQGIADFMGSAASTGTGVLNIVGGLFGKELDRTNVRGIKRDPSSWSSLAGGFADPAAAMVGAGAGKAAQMIPKLGQLGKNVAAGTAAGGVIGGLSEEGSAAGGALAGGAFGAAIPLLGKVAGKIGDLVRGRGGDIRAGRILREAGGPDIAQRLAAAPAGPLNVAQAYGADAPVALAGVQRFADDQLAGAQRAANIARQQAATRQAAMARVAGGGSAEEAAVAQQVARRQLGADTNPQRIAELGAANEANQQLGKMLPQVAQKRASEIAALQGQGRTATESAQQRVLGENFYPVEGHPRFPSRYAPQTDRAAEFADTASDFAAIKAQRQGEREFIERKIGSLEKYGLRPLTADPIVASIRAKLLQPGDRATSMVQKVLGGIDDAISQAAKNNGGVLDAYDLHAIRKYEINSVIDDLLKDASKSDKARAGKLADDVKSAIDTAISNAGGTGWKDYLSKYSMGMRSIDKMAMAQAAKDLPDKQLIKLAEGNKPKLVEKIFGPGQRSFTGAMGSDAAPFQQAASELSRDRALSESAKAGGGAAGEILKKHMFGFTPPNMLNTQMTVIHKAVNFLGDKLNASTIEKLSQAMQDPRKAMQVMQTLPASERSLILKAMQNPVVTGTAAGMLTGATQ